MPTLTTARHVLSVKSIPSLIFPRNTYYRVFLDEMVERFWQKPTPNIKAPV
jgi:hypothetical protein